MLLRRIIAIPAALLAPVVLSGLWGTPALGQLRSPLPEPPPASIVSADGTASIERFPTRLRLGVLLEGKGKTLEEALGRLQDRRQKVAAGLEPLGVDKQSITFGAPGFSAAVGQQRQQLERMIRERMRVTGQALPKGLQLPQVRSVAAMLQAEWPLPAGTPEEVLLAAQAIQDKVAALDLAGKKDEQALSPEEQELVEEMQGMAQQSFPSPYGQEQAEPGQPLFVYVAEISEQDRDRVMAEAFQKAKTKAERLARSAGRGLGSIQVLTEQNITSPEYYDPYSGGMPQAVAFLSGRAGPGGQPDQENLIASPTAGPITFRFTVSATFSLELPRVQAAPPGR